MESIDASLADILEGFLDVPLEFGLPKASENTYHTLDGSNPSLQLMHTLGKQGEQLQARHSVQLHAESSSNVFDRNQPDWNCAQQDTFGIAIPSNNFNTKPSMEDQKWGASFDLENLGSSFRGPPHFPEEAVSIICPQNQWVQNSVHVPDFTQTTSSHTGERREMDQHANDSEQEDKESEEGIRESSSKKPGSSRNLKLARISSDSQQHDLRKTRRREKDRIEELQQDIQRLSDSVQMLDLSIETLSTQLKEKEEALRQAKGMDESTLSNGEDEHLNTAFNIPLKLTIFGKPGREAKSFSPEQVKCMSEEELRLLWSAYVSQMRNGLQNMSHPAYLGQGSDERLMTLQQEAVILFLRSSLSNVNTIKRVLEKGGQNQTQSQSPDWHKVASLMRLSREQENRLSQFHEKYVACIARLMEVRTKITQHIRSTIPDGLFGRSFAINFLKAHELMDALRYNLRQEHIALNDLTANFFNVLSAPQFAACAVHSWPCLPDIPQIVHCICTNKSVP